MIATRLSSRAVVRLSPSAPEEDVADFLQGLVTSDVTGALPVWTGLLTPQGKVLFDFIVWPAAALQDAGAAHADGGLLIDCEAEVADALAKRLTLYRLRRAIGIARDDSLAVHWRAQGEDGTTLDPRLPALGARWIAPVADLADPDRTDAGNADEAWRAHRLALGIAEGRAELGDGTTLWLECNAAELNGVSFTKGCYVGQENTARMNWRQKVNRRLVVVPLAESDPARQRATYPALDLAVDYRRIEDIAPSSRPAWMPLPVDVEEDT